MKTRATLVLGLLCALAATVASAAPVAYTTPTAGAVSLGIYDQQGRLLRTLQAGKKMAAGPQQLEWDGRDDLGRDLPAGPYTLKGLVANLGWQYQLEVGNSGQPPWLNADGTGGWGGVHGDVQQVAVDPNGHDLYLLWRMEEGTPALIKVDPAGGTGKFKLWGAHVSWAWGLCSALATDGQYVYIANNFPTGCDLPTRAALKTTKALLWRARADTGEYAPYPGANNGPVEISSLPIDALPDLPRSWDSYAHPERRRSNVFGLDFAGVAVDKTHLYCSLRAEDKLLILDKATAAPVRTVAVDAPGGLCLAPDGNLYLLSGRKLLKLSPDGVVLGTVLDRGLEAPSGLCVDAAGNLYISDQGAAMQVKVFSPAGALLRTVGRAGGRALGGAWATMKSDLLYPTAPAVAADGTLYVGEEAAPKRVAIFKKGKWADEWIGPLASGCNAIDICDEQNPQYLYQLAYAEPGGLLTRYRVDYAKKTGVVDAVWGQFNVRDGRIKADSVCHSPEGGGFIRHLGGKTFLCSNGEIWRLNGYNLVPAARVWWKPMGRANDDALWRLAQTWPSKPAKIGPYKPGTVPYYPVFWTWRDKNGDGEVQEDEVDFSTPPGNDNVRMTGGSTWVHSYWDAQMNLYAWGYKIPCAGLDATGNPIYSWSQAELLPRRPMGQLGDPKLYTSLNTAASNVPYDAPLDLPGALVAGGRGVNYWTDPEDGGLYQVCDVEGKGKGLGWASSGIFGRLGKTDKQGNWVWMASSKATAFVKPGQFYKSGMFAGIVQGLLFITDWNGQLRVWDKDTGLYAGSLFADGYKGPVPDENLIEVEYNVAHAYRNRQNGQVYATGGDGEGLKLYRVTGVDEVQRFSAPVTLAAAAPAPAPAATAPAAPVTEAGPLKIMRAPGPVTIDGDLADWNLAGKVGPVSFDPDAMAEYHATCYAMYDAEYLYLAAVVVEPHPPHNTSPVKGFGSWNGDDVILRMSSNPALKFPLEGDRTSLKNCLDMFQADFWYNEGKQQTYWDGGYGFGGPAVLGDQWGATASAVKLAPDGKGYTEEIRVPWPTINPNFHPQSGDRIGLTWDLCIGTATAAEPTRAFEIFVNGGGTWAFTSPGTWGPAVFQ